MKSQINLNLDRKIPCFPVRLVGPWVRVKLEYYIPYVKYLEVIHQGGPGWLSHLSKQPTLGFSSDHNHFRVAWNLLMILSLPLPMRLPLKRQHMVEGLSKWFFVFFFRVMKYFKFIKVLKWKKNCLIWARKYSNYVIIHFLSWLPFESHSYFNISCSSLETL